MAFLYPWGNTQQLNLDWILQKIKELESGGGGSGADIEEIANVLVALTYRSANSYQRYDYAFYNGKLYRAIANTTGAFNPADWLEVQLGNDVAILTRLVYAVDASLTTLQGQVADLDSDDVDNASNVTGDNVSDALNNLNGALNAITPLDTAPTSGSPKGITSGAVYTAEHTVTQPTVSRGNDIIAGTNLILNDCRTFQKVVTYRAQLESKTSSEVTYPHNTVMFTGLPHPYQNIIFMANTFLENKSDQHQYRLVLTTDGDIKPYWDTAHVPKTGSAFLVDITYLTSE